MAGQNHRLFSSSTVIFQAIIVDPDWQILLFSSPKRNKGWQSISGTLEVGHYNQSNPGSQVKIKDALMALSELSS